MRDLYNRVVEDPAIKDMIVKAQGFSNPPLIRPVIVMESRSSKYGTASHTRLVYSNRAEYEKMFTEEVRAAFNGRTLIHERGTRRFVCLTDIVDESGEDKKGKWVIFGTTEKDGFFAKEFDKKDEADKFLPTALGIFQAYAVMHQYGTKDYTLFEASITVRFEKPGEEIVQDISKSIEVEVLHEPELEITEPEAIDLREEELNEKEE